RFQEADIERHAGIARDSMARRHRSVGGNARGQRGDLRRCGRGFDLAWFAGHPALSPSPSGALSTSIAPYSLRHESQAILVNSAWYQLLIDWSKLDSRDVMSALPVLSGAFHRIVVSGEVFAGEPGNCRE